MTAASWKKESEAHVGTGARVFAACARDSKVSLLAGYCRTCLKSHIIIFSNFTIRYSCGHLLITYSDAKSMPDVNPMS